MSLPGSSEEERFFDDHRTALVEDLEDSSLLGASLVVSRYTVSEEDVLDVDAADAASLSGNQKERRRRTHGGVSLLEGVGPSDEHCRMVRRLYYLYGVRYYLVEWFIVGIFLLLTLLLNQFVEPFQRNFPVGYEDNFPMCMYAKAEDVAVPTWLVFLLASLIPLSVFLLAQLFPRWRGGHEFHMAMLSIFEAVAFCLLFTEGTKLYAGRHRPDFYAYANSPGVSKAKMMDEHQSFPSGHASVIFCTMTMISLYVAGKIRLFDRELPGQLWKLLLICLPQVLAIFVSVSRTRDYRHNFDDILAGAVLGTPFSFIGYLMNYHHFWHKNCERPLVRVLPSDLR